LSQPLELTPRLAHRGKGHHPTNGYVASITTLDKIDHKRSFKTITLSNTQATMGEMARQEVMKFSVLITQQATLPAKSFP